MKTYIALENLRSLYNVGAIMRTAEFFGINNLILIGYSGINPNDPDLIHQKLKKTALSSFPKVQIETFKNIKDVAKQHSEPIIGLENNVPNTKSLYKWSPPKDLILLMGNEVNGISDQAKEIATEFIEIPRVGTHPSLNVATAAGIAISHIAEYSMR